MNRKYAVPELNITKLISSGRPIADELYGASAPLPSLGGDNEGDAGIWD